MPLPNNDGDVNLNALKPKLKSMLVTVNKQNVHMNFISDSTIEIKIGKKIDAKISSIHRLKICKNNGSFE